MKWATSLLLCVVLYTAIEKSLQLIATSCIPSFSFTHRQFGNINHVLISKKKNGSAIVEFETLEGAVSIWTLKIIDNVLQISLI